jgi:hypothetical protein
VVAEYACVFAYYCKLFPGSSSVRLTANDKSRILRSTVGCSKFGQLVHGN